MEGILFPKYDKQKDIYTDALKGAWMKQLLLLSASNPDDGFSDLLILFIMVILQNGKNGVTQLCLRMAMRVSNVDAAMAATYVSKAVAGGVFDKQ